MPNFIFKSPIKFYSTFIHSNFIGKVASTDYTFIMQVWFQSETSSFNSYILFPKSQWQCDMLLHHSFDIIDLKTQRLGCEDSQLKGCDVCPVM